MVRDDELVHYGVLGMKWGVRKNPSRAYTKAVKKRTKLENKAVNYNLRSTKLRYKAMKKSAYAITEGGRKRAWKMEARANRYALTSARYQKRGLNWTRVMEKTFADYDIRRLSKSEIEAGKKYVYELTKKKK